jgi:hypothetical protein
MGHTRKSTTMGPTSKSNKLERKWESTATGTKPSHVYRPQRHQIRINENGNQMGINHCIQFPYGKLITAGTEDEREHLI